MGIEPTEASVAHSLPTLGVAAFSCRRRESNPRHPGAATLRSGLCTSRDTHVVHRTAALTGTETDVRPALRRACRGTVAPPPTAIHEDLRTVPPQSLSASTQDTSAISGLAALGNLRTRRRLIPHPSEPTARIELATSPLPRERSTAEQRGQTELATGVEPATSGVQNQRTTGLCYASEIKRSSTDVFGPLQRGSYSAVLHSPSGDQPGTSVLLRQLGALHQN